ncbi:MAG: BatD family protein [Phycisphaerales bacterium]|nr:MAG: BatD family protein [Phycisphaerales bacterium]
MKPLAMYILLGFALAATVPARAETQVRVIAQVDTSKEIYVGDSFVYRIIIDGDDKPGQVDLAPLAKYSPQDAGGGNASQTSTTIINRKVTTQVVKRYVMNYLLTAAEPGRAVLPALTVTVGGKDYRTNPVAVNVLKPGTTDQLALEVALSEQRCYVGQPVILTVKFYVAASADVGDFQFNIPALVSDAFYVEEPDVTDPQAKQYRLHTGMSVAVSQHRVVYRGSDFILVSFNKVLIPKHSGQIPMGKASVTAALAVGRTRSRDPFFDNFSLFRSRKDYRRFMVDARPVTLTVLPLPEEGKPSEFYGLVGRYTISATATPTEVSVGDPITLTVRIGGNRYLKPVQWPALETLPNLAANFKIPAQRASPTIEDSSKVFTQTIRAGNDKVTQIPPIPLAYFDPDKGRYAIARTDPIEIEVAPTRILTVADMEGAEPTVVNREVAAIKEGLSANYEDLSVLRNMSFSPLAAVVSPGYAAIWSVPLAALVASVLIKLFTHTTVEKQALRRRRRACSKAVRQLKGIASAKGQAQCESLALVMTEYIAARFDKVAGSLTAEDCREVIVTATADAATAGRYRDVIARCEAARYTSAPGAADNIRVKDAIELVRTVEKKSKR